MKDPITGRVVAATVLSVLCGWRVSHDMLLKHMAGKDAYLAYQSAWFDKYLNHFSHPVAHMIGYALFFITGVAIYEGLTWLFSLPSKRRKNATV